MSVTAQQLQSQRQPRVKGLVSIETLNILPKDMGPCPQRTSAVCQ